MFFLVIRERLGEREGEGCVWDGECILRVSSSSGRIFGVDGPGFGFHERTEYEDLFVAPKDAVYFLPGIYDFQFIFVMFLDGEKAPRR